MKGYFAITNSLEGLRQREAKPLVGCFSALTLFFFLFAGSERIVKSPLASKHLSGTFRLSRFFAQHQPKIIFFGSKQIYVRCSRQRHHSLLHHWPNCSISLGAISLFNWTVRIIGILCSLVIGAYVENERLQRAIRYTIVVGLVCADLLVGLLSLKKYGFISLSLNMMTLLYIKPCIRSR